MAADQPRQKASQQQPKKVPASAFYDATSLKRLRDQEFLNSRPKRPAQKQPFFNPLHAPYRIFKTQAAAFEFLDAQACSSILRTFALETAETGQRDFIVASAACFWQTYAALPARQRHHYEIIRQGTPCNLYFDLEFSPEVNSGLNGPRLVEVLVTGVKELLLELYGVRLEDQHVLELDSSTPSKFSRHLIVQLPGLAFADCCHAGRFARCVLLRLLAKGAHSSSYGGFLVRNKDGGLTSFVDMGVYTRNRAFRLYLSSKFGKPAVLRLTHRFGGPSRCPKAAFHDCLVSVLAPAGLTHQQQIFSSGVHRSSGKAALVAVGASRRDADSPSAERRTVGDLSSSGSSGGGGDGEAASAAGLSLLYMETDGQQELLQLPATWQQIPMLQLRPLEHISPGASAAAGRRPCLSSLQRQACRPGTAPGAPGALAAAAWSCQPCYGPSPFPALDAFMNSVVVSAGGPQAGIRNWLLQPPGCVVFNVKGNRWCGNVERAHRSNGIFYCVDLSAGVYYQKCYDPECRHYRSNLMPLPTDVWHAYKHLAVSAAPGGSAEQGPRQRQQDQQDQQDQQQQQVQAVAAATAADEAEEDEECLTLLLQCEQQQQQQQQAHTHSYQQQQQPHDHRRHHPQQQRQQGPEQPDPCHESCMVAGLPQPSTACASTPGPCECGVGLQEECDVGLQEDELCMQLLQDVEQQHMSRPHGVAVG